MLNACRCGIRALVILVASALVTVVAANAETASPQAFVEGIYKHYRGKEAPGIPLSGGDEVIRRYFAPPLADAIIKDLAEATNEPPSLNGDPFLDAQEGDVSDFVIVVKSTGARTAVAAVNFMISKNIRTVTLELVNTPAGWRIADVRGPSGSLRALYKLK